MKQLVQLRDAKDKIKKLGGTIVVVQREDKLRGDGLKRTIENTKTDFVFLDDLNAKATANYSQGAFKTYIIDGNGFVRFVIDGTKTKRPEAAKIIARLGELKGKS